MFEEILKRNKTKWKILPAGQSKKNIDELMRLDDSQLIKEYKSYIVFWEKERGWEYKTYINLFKERSILEIGSGLGYDGMVFSKEAKCWTYSDIVFENIQFLKRITRLFNISNVKFEYIEDIIQHEFPDHYDGLYAHGVLHHIPFEIAKLQVKNIDKFLKPGAKVVCLMYPKERWEYYGCPKFTEFGKITDGEETPWAEWYDEEKIIKLFGDNYRLISSKRWGWKGIEFINFVLHKKK